jgi:hypothetical protein
MGRRIPDRRCAVADEWANKLYRFRGRDASQGEGLFDQRGRGLCHWRRYEPGHENCGNGEHKDSGNCESCGSCVATMRYLRIDRWLLLIAPQLRERCIERTW